MLKSQRRLGFLTAMLAVGAMLSSSAAPAFAAKKKKHPKHAPAHHTKAHPGATPATEEAPEPAASDEAAEPAGESAPAHHASPAAEDKPEETSRDRSAEAGDDSSAPREAAARPHAQTENESETEDEEAASGARLPPALRGGIGMSALYRRLTWSGAHAGLAGYSMAPGPEFGGWLEVYPGALVDRGFGANIGAILSFNRGFGISSTSASGFSSSVIFEDFLLGLKMRFPLGFFVPHVSAAYAGQVFLFSPRIPEVPSVFYSSARLAAGLRAQVADAVDAEIEAAYLAVVDSGKQAGYIGATEYFPGLGNYGLEASASLGVRVTGVFGLRAGVDFRQYALDLSHATGMLMADKATDRYLSIWGGVEVVLDGAGGTAAKPRPENKPPAPPGAAISD